MQIPATLSGIRAARTIARLGPASNRIKLNLIQVQGLTHAVSCLLAGPFAITVSVGPVSNPLGWPWSGGWHPYAQYDVQVLRWHEGRSPTPFPSLNPLQHPGMMKIHGIRLFFEKLRVPITLLAAECRKECSFHQLCIKYSPNASFANRLTRSSSSSSFQDTCFHCRG